MAYIATLWSESPYLFLIGYIVVGMVFACIILYLDYPSVKEFVQDLYKILPGGRARYRKILQETPSGVSSHNGINTTHYLDEDMVRVYMRTYPIKAATLWLYLLVLLFAWPLLLTIIMTLMLIGIVVSILR